MIVLDVVSLIVGIFGIIVGVYFGLRSMFQSQDIEALQTAVRALSQGMFNNIWRMGANAENAEKASDWAAALRLVRGIADMSQTARQTLIAFSREHTGFCPSQEDGWKPLPVGPPRQRTLLRKIFAI